MTLRARAAVWAGVAVMIAWGWQFLTVRYNYGGNWTGLFCIAPHMPKPDFLRSEKLYIFPNSDGFDGQVYHLIAHDPWLRRGSADAIVGPAIFYQRILVPALAWTLAFGRDRWIDPAYIGVVLLFIFLGAYWSGRIAANAGLRPFWGMVGFLLAPATATSIDRMTVDVAVAACVAGFAFYSKEGPKWKVFGLLACAAVAKEQAVPIIIGYALYLVVRKQWLTAGWMLAAGAPGFAWFLYLRAVRPVPPLITTMSWIPLAGFFDAVRHPFHYGFTPFKNAAGVLFDYVALCGFVIALGLTIRLAIERRSNPKTWAAYMLAISSLGLRNPVLWTVYNFGRGLTPLFLLVAFEELREHPWLAALPMVMVDSRIALNFAAQILGIFHGLTGFGAIAPVK
jgi:hypothetical protein